MRHNRVVLSSLVFLCFLISSCSTPKVEGTLSSLEKTPLSISQDYYKNLYKSLVTNFGNKFDENSINAMYNYLGDQGYVSDRVQLLDGNMKNYEVFERFLGCATKGDLVEETIYTVHDDGSLYCMVFRSDKAKMEVSTFWLYLDESMNPYMSSAENIDIESWKYTEKGYFIYKIDADVFNYVLIRVKPLGTREQELCRKYILPIGYQGSDLFLTQWDNASLEKIDFNDLFEYLWLNDNKKSEESYNFAENIPADIFEPLIMKYFNVTQECLQKSINYNNVTREYFCVPLSNKLNELYFPAVDAEVVAIQENEEGSLTLTVDAIDYYYGNDCVFTHMVTIKDNSDGSFTYLSNVIEPSSVGNVLEYIKNGGSR